MADASASRGDEKKGVLGRKERGEEFLTLSERDEYYHQRNLSCYGIA